VRPNNSFKPNPLRGFSPKPELLGRVGLIQVLALMSKRIAIVIVLLICFGCATNNAPRVATGRTCTPDISWHDIPPKIRSKISKAVYGEVSPQGGPFNSTDVTRGSTPQARFFGACRTAKQWNIAIERGGRAHHLVLFKFSGTGMADTWTAYLPPGGFTPELLSKQDER
jgi:hypothetical protein